MNKTYEAEQTPKTPFIELNAETGSFKIRGKSIPENSVLFYKPLFEWLDNYIQTPSKSTVLDIQLDYFNTSSAKIFADLFRKLEGLQSSAKSEVLINWQYNDIDDDMQEAGEDYKSISKVNFNLVSFTK